MWAKIKNKIHEWTKPKPLTYMIMELDMSDEAMSANWEACRQCFKEDSIIIDHKMAATCGVILAGIAAKVNSDESTFTINGLHDKQLDKVYGDFEIKITRIKKPQDECKTNGNI
jgi:hypothetical protein